MSAEPAQELRCGGLHKYPPPRSSGPLDGPIRNIKPMDFPPQDDTQLILLGGLPGSGKTHYARQLEERGWVFYDDFQNRAPADSTLFGESRHYMELLSHLRSGRKCIVSDIRVIHDEYRRSATAALRTDIGSPASELHLFVNDREQCARNVRNAKDGRSVEPRLKAIELWSRHYSAPPSAVIHPVWRPPIEAAKGQP